MMSVENQNDNTNTDTNTEQNGEVGNSTQERFSELTECPACHEDTRINNPRVAIVTCDNDSCALGTFVLQDDPRYE